MMKAYLNLFFALLLVCISTGAVLAQTPDGETPAEETVCDDETGAAYGLCNAYCEAMDCESDNPSASATACSRVRNKFEQITGRDLPCEVPPVTCPCNDPAVSPRFANLVAGQSGVSSCSRVDGGIVINLGGPGDNVFSRPSAGQWQCGAIRDNVTLPITPEQGLYCAQLLEQTANSQGETCQ